MKVISEPDSHNLVRNACRNAINDLGAPGQDVATFRNNGAKHCRLIAQASKLVFTEADKQCNDPKGDWRNVKILATNCRQIAEGKNLPIHVAKMRELREYLVKIDVLS